MKHGKYEKRSVGLLNSNDKNIVRYSTVERMKQKKKTKKMTVKTRAIQKFTDSLIAFARLENLIP